jgi:hypothetical protein
MGAVHVISFKVLVRFKRYILYTYCIIRELLRELDLHEIIEGETQRNWFYLIIGFSYWLFLLFLFKSKIRSGKNSKYEGKSIFYF